MIPTMRKSMKEYEYRRTVFYQMRGHEKFEDEHANFPIVFNESSVIEDAIIYLQNGTSYLRFPGAARAVAIAAADLVVKRFNENFYAVLEDKNLMHGNDPYFKTYSEDKEVYDAILSQVPRDSINWNSERMAITRRLILQEYMLDDDGLTILARS
jgi:hypothetical protein